MSPQLLGQLLPIVVVVLLLYLLVIRPARRRAHQVSTLQAALSPGDEVMLTSGIFGTISSLEDDRVKVAVADGVVLTVHRGAISEIVRDVPAEVEGGSAAGSDDDSLRDDSVDAAPSEPPPPGQETATGSRDANTRGAN